MTYTDLIDKYGTASNAGARLGFSKQALSDWKKKGIPFNSQYLIQLKTRGRLKADVSALARKKAA